jgi:hypothetical protein
MLGADRIELIARAEEQVERSRIELAAGLH